MPIGVSFFTFSLLSYLFDVYRDRAPAARNMLDFSLYVTFFPKLVSGPIVQYAEMEPQLRDHPVTREGFGSGARLFLIGLAKKVLLANTLGTTFYALSALPMTQLSTLSAWLGAVCYALMLYFDFSGYSDMAIGLASMFGFRFGRNFDYPYVSQSITEFWRRWHISLGAWFRDYVYIPCGGSRAGTARTIANLLLVWLLTGIWHGANWTFLLWGVYYGILLLLEKFVLRHVLTLLLVLIGWVFFFSSSPAAAFGWIGRMFGSGSALIDATAKYYLAGCWPLLLVGAIGSFPVVSHVGTNLLRKLGPDQFVQDDFIHEHSLVLEGEDGLVVFNSCSHGGIVNIVQGVQEALNRQVTTVVGGLHMFSTSTLSGLNCPPEYPGQVARALKEQGVRRVYTGHCTGETALALLREELGDALIPLTCGLTFSL